MSQRERIAWAQLRVGILVIISLNGFRRSHFFIAARWDSSRRRYTIKAYLPSASDLREGASVRLAASW